jgi:hypothetical protein
MLQHHNIDKHEYIIAAPVLDSDVIITLPKLKTHKKAGISISLKNVIGINCYKDCLPHYKKGSTEEGSDEYPYKNKIKGLLDSLEEIEDTFNNILFSLLMKIPKKIIYWLARAFSKDKYFEGSWWGNDTLWRTIIDLNNILFYWDGKTQHLNNKQQRKLLTIVDGVVSGEGDGPLASQPKLAGILMAGYNPMALDMVGTRLMDFDWRKIPTLSKGNQLFLSPLRENIKITCSNPQLNERILCDSTTNYFKFIPPSGWKNHIEL